MKPLPLNISKMIKIACDGKTSTFKHPAGHEIVVLHAALPASMRKEIEKLPLAKGGEVKLAVHEEGVNKQSGIKEAGQGTSIAGKLVRDGHVKEAKASHANRLQQLRDMPKPKLAEGGDVLPKYMHPPKDPKMEAVPRLAIAEGGQVAKPTGSSDSKPVQDASEYDQTLANGWKNIKKAFMAEGGLLMEGQGPCKNPNCKSHGKPHPNCRCYGGYAKGGVVQSACESGSYHHPSCQYYADGEVKPQTMDLSEGPYTGDVPRAARDAFDAHKKEQHKHDDVKKDIGESTEDYPVMKAKGGKVKMYADPQEPVSANDSAPVMEAASPSPEAQPVAPQPTPIAEVNPAAAMASQNPMQGVAVPTVPEGRNNLNPDEKNTMNPSAVAENAQTAADAERDVAIAAGKAHANMQIGAQQAIIANQQMLQQNYKNIAGHVQDFDTWMSKNQVNSNHYVESMGAGRKTATALGLFLGGLGQTNGGSNPALDYLNRQIDRDIDAQKSRVDQARTIYGAYRDLYGDGKATYDATKASMLDILARQSDQITDQLGTPLARANNLKLKAQIAIDKSKSLQDAAVSLGSLPGTRAENRHAPSSQGTAPASAPSLPMSSPAKDHKGIEHGASSGWDENSSVEKLGGESSNNDTLVPGHKRRVQELQKFNIFSKDPNRAAGLQESYNQQLKVDEALGRVDDLYDTMYSETNGLSGRIHRGINPHAIAAGTGAAGTIAGGIVGGLPSMGVGTVPGAIGGGTIGAGLGEGIGHGLQAVTNTDANAKYDTDYATLKSMIAAALPNRGDALVEELARKYAPTDRDSKAGAIKKREALKADLVQLSHNGPLQQVELIKGKKKK